MEDLIELLREGHHSLVVSGESLRTFDGRGVSDLYRLLDAEPEFLKGSRLADRIVGKAAASLMALAEVKEVHAEVISEPGLNMLNEAGIKTEYGILVPNIINRDGTGICPLEARCKDYHTPEDCFVQISLFMEKMNNRR